MERTTPRFFVANCQHNAIKKWGQLMSPSTIEIMDENLTLGLFPQVMFFYSKPHKSFATCVASVCANTIDGSSAFC